MASTDTFNEIMGTVKANKSGSNALLASQNKQQQTLFNKYQALIKSQPTMANEYTRLSGEAGIPELQNTLGGLNTQMANVQGLLSNLGENINSRTQGTFTTQAQKDRLLAYEQAPLTKQLAEIGIAQTPLQQQLTTSQQNIANMLGLISQDQQKQLQPLIMQIDSLSDKFAREITMYNNNAQNKLTALIQKYTQEGSLELEQMKEANALAMQEADFANQKAMAAQSFANSVSLKNMDIAASKEESPSLKSELGKMAGYVVYGKTTPTSVDFVNPKTGALMTREQAGRILANDTGVGYDEAMKNIYATFPG